jgi:hypothetical protein
VTVKIRFDRDSLDAAESGVIWGGVWLELNGEAFPEAHWNDLAVAVMVEVVIALRELERAVGQRRIRFFDGPFWIEVEHTTTGHVAISTSAGLQAECELLEFAHVVRQAEEAACELVVACKALGFSNQDDVRRLEALCAEGR